jgi:adenosylcobinamide-GDP ribazoletransferase
MLTDVRAAFVLLTRLPVGFMDTPNFARCVWAFPIVGLVVGSAGGLVYWAAHLVGMPPLLAAVWSLAASMILTGALHEDGLSDTADGFGGGVGQARKLEIMRDSRIGNYGAAALVLSVLIRTTAIAALGRPIPVLTAMVLAGMLGRSAMILPLLVLVPARVDGMGASVRRPPGLMAAVGLAVSLIAACVFLPLVPAAVSVMFGLGSALLVTGLAHRQVGGYTGDVLGAAEVVSECVVVTVLATWLGRLGGVV